MVNVELLNQEFSQHSNSCVMASYAIVSHFFNNRINITDIFDEYCNHFHIPWVTHLESESHCSNHINFICPYILHWRGYNMVDYLHKHSIMNLFNQNRALFTSEVISINPLSDDEYYGLITRLRNDVALANVLVLNDGGFHSMTLGIDQLTNGIFTHNTALKTSSKLSNVVKLKPNDIRECIIFTGIST